MTMAGIETNLIHVDDISPFDIKSGRGGHASHSAPHQNFLDYRDILRRLYKLAKTNREKRVIQQMLVDYVHQQLGGRFICKVSANYFIEITMQDALKKCANALREDRVRYRNKMMHDHDRSDDRLTVAVNLVDVVQNDIVPGGFDVFDKALDRFDIANDEIDTYIDGLNFLDGENDIFTDGFEDFDLFDDERDTFHSRFDEFEFFTESSDIVDEAFKFFGEIIEL